MWGNAGVGLRVAGLFLRQIVQIVVRNRRGLRSLRAPGGRLGGRWSSIFLFVGAVPEFIFGEIPLGVFGGAFGAFRTVGNGDFIRLAHGRAAECRIVDCHRVDAGI